LILILVVSVMLMVERVERANREAAKPRSAHKKRRHHR
jgi:hypothetical protein